MEEAGGGYVWRCGSTKLDLERFNWRESPREDVETTPGLFERRLGACEELAGAVATEPAPVLEVALGEVIFAKSLGSRSCTVCCRSGSIGALDDVFWRAGPTLRARERLDAGPLDRELTGSESLADGARTW